MLPSKEIIKYSRSRKARFCPSKCLVQAKYKISLMILFPVVVFVSLPLEPAELWALRESRVFVPKLFLLLLVLVDAIT